MFHHNVASRLHKGLSGKILVVDDDAGMRRSLAIMLRRDGHGVSEARGGQEAADQIGREVFDLVITDLRMDSVSGLELLQTMKQSNPGVEVIVMTAYGTIETAVEAMKLGAFDFITKPFQAEEILLRVRNALEKRSLSEEVNQLRAEVKSAFGFQEIVGVSEEIRKVLALLPRVAQTDSTVLITGESGTGKELIARALHASSRRGSGPFISVSCAAFPEQLLEDELFGHVKGAFTGAVAARKGLFEEARSGTFFLDEVGEASLSIQAKLLRVLEERSIRRLGDNRTVSVDVRIIAATNRDLHGAVKEKSFREDLYYRLNVIRIHLSPLRERREDIPLLAKYFLARHSARAAQKIDGFSPAAIECLMTYNFPGNVRELSNVVEQAVALSRGPVIELEDLPDGVFIAAHASALSLPQTSPGGIAAVERDLILERFRIRQGNLSLVAKDLGISRTTLWRRMKEYKIGSLTGEPEDVSC